jgi:tetratricopeptide (TPR) repeat protein/TolB-like protein
MRSLPKLFALLLTLAVVSPPPGVLFAQTAPEADTGRVVLVLPFDNLSGDASLNWIGDSFPNTLNKRINSAGFLTISRDDRAFAFDHLGLPAGFRPSRATTIRIAEQLDANFVIIGSYNVQKTLAATNGAAAQGSTGGPAAGSRISIQSKVLSIDELRLSPPVEDRAQLDRLFDAENAIAWKVARVLDPNFSVAEQTFLAAPGAVPLPAFEDYIRGANASTTDESIKRLQQAVTLAPGYSGALLALGKQQYATRDFDAAAATLAKVPKRDPLALEANFYLGLSRFNSANYAAAEQAFAFVATRLPLPEVVNNEAVALSRQGKDAVAFFQRASAADPSDEDYRYNLAIALFRRGDTAAALQQADAALKLKPGDNEAGELRARLSLAAPGTRLDANAASGFSPVERIRRSYSEAGFRQAAFQLDQMRALRMASLPPAQRATEYTQLGSGYLAQGLLPEAEVQFQAALSADPNSATAHAGLAQVREASGSAAEARDQARTSLILQPNVAAYLVLARLDLAAKQLAASADDVGHALQLEPANPAAQALRTALQQRGQAVGPPGGNGATPPPAAKPPATPPAGDRPPR